MNAPFVGLIVPQSCVVPLVDLTPYNKSSPTVAICAVAGIGDNINKYKNKNNLIFLAIFVFQLI